MTEKKDEQLVVARSGQMEIIEGRSLHRKLAQVMWEAERIPKNGTAPASMGGFKFVQVGDAADAIRKALAEKSVSMIPTAIELLGETEHQTQNGKAMTTMTVRTTWTLTDGDSGESIEIQSIGSGADMGDKAAPKAQSSAMKYALLMGFLLSTGDDPEMSDTSDRQRAAPDGAHAPAAAPARPPEPDVETEELLGVLSKSGVVKNGTANGYKLEPRQGPDGHVIGFRLEIDGERSIPQVLVEGALGEKLYLATSANPAALLSERVTVKGRLFNVKRPGRQSYYRMRLTEMTWGDFHLDTATDEPELPAPPDDVELLAEAPSVPLGLVS